MYGYHPDYEFSFGHRCETCGCRYGDHKGGTDDHGPEHRCPKTRTFGEPVKLNDSVVDNDQYWRNVASHWGARDTTFVPRR